MYFKFTFQYRKADKKLKRAQIVQLLKVHDKSDCKFD